jgi:hypothetical protein
MQVIEGDPGCGLRAWFVQIHDVKEPLNRGFYFARMKNAKVKQNCL